LRCRRATSPGRSSRPGTLWGQTVRIATSSNSKRSRSVYAAIQFAVASSGLPFRDRIRDACHDALFDVLSQRNEIVVSWLREREVLYDDAIAKGRGSGTPEAVGRAYATLFEDAPDAAVIGARSFANTVKSMRRVLTCYRVVDG